MRLRLRWIVLLAYLALPAALSRADITAATEPTSQASTISSSAADFSADLTGEWFGARRKLADSGITIGANLVLEGFANFKGGIDTAHLVGATTFDLNLTADMEKLIGLHGGEFYVDLEDHAFRNPTTALVGDLQVFDKTTASPYLQFYELWYQQTFFNDKLRLKFGKVDSNLEFDVVENGLLFLNSSAQLSPTIFLMPTTPDPMPGINAFFAPADWFYAGVGAYYSNQSDRFGDLVGDPASVQPTKYGAFIIGETGLKWQSAGFLKYAGNLKIGAWGHTGTFHTFGSSQQNGTEGAYAVFNQTLYQPQGEPTSGRGVRMFAEYGWTEPNIDPIDQHIGFGITDTGPIAAMSQDVIGFSPQYAQIGRQSGRTYPYELALEIFDRHPFTPWTILQPDLQYIIHPGGKFPDALVFTLRLEINF